MKKKLRKLMKLKNTRRLHRDEEGSVAVEFALVIVPFLMMVFGIFETGQVLWASSQIDFQVDRIVREAAIDSSISAGTIQSSITAALGDLDASQLVVTVARTNGTPDILQVSVAYTHMPVTPFLFASGIALDHTSAYPMIDG